MTDKINEALEWHKDGTLLFTLKHVGWKNGIEQFQNATTIKVDGDNAEAVAETILKALSAYEKLQGVDIKYDLLNCALEDFLDFNKCHDGLLHEQDQQLYSAAQLVADINNEERN